jgi:general stress protein 26
MSDTSALRKLTDLIGAIRIGLLTTMDLNGSLHTRPVETLRCDADATLWFFTDYQSPKADELSHDVRVSVGYSDPSNNRYVAVAGRACILRDKSLATELWTPAQRAWYPKGVDDEHLSILRITTERAEYWETPGRVSYLLAGAVAMVTGKPASVGQSHKVP